MTSVPAGGEVETAARHLNILFLIAEPDSVIGIVRS